MRFLINTIFFDKIVLPIKCILNQPFFYELVTENSNKLDLIFNLIQPQIISENPQQTIIEASKELKIRGDLNLYKKQIDRFASMLHESKIKLIRINKLRFHKNYWKYLIRYLDNIDQKGIVLDQQKQIPKGSLTKVVDAIRKEDPEKWDEKNYFGSRDALKIIEENECLYKDMLKMMIFSIWLYTIQSEPSEHPLHMGMPKHYIQYYNSFHLFDLASELLKENTSIGKQNKIHKKQIAKLYKQGNLSLGIPIISKRVRLESIIKIRESDFIRKYRELVNIIRKSESEEDDSKIIKKIERKYNEFLISMVKYVSNNPYCSDDDLERKIEEYQKKLRSGWISKLLDMSGYTQYGYLACNLFFQSGPVLVPFIMSAPLLVRDLCKIKKWHDRQSVITDYFESETIYPYYYNPNTGDVEFR